MIDSGPISGKIENGLGLYFGIPYAAPPVGNLRWKPPQPVTPWKDVRDCTQFGPSCPQPPAPIAFPDESVGTVSQDCLYLNVWTPAEKADAKLPVMVWIHGGGFFEGSGSMKGYNCQNLAKKGVVAVNINYNDAEDALACMRSKTPKELLKVTNANMSHLGSIQRDSSLLQQSMGGFFLMFP